MVLHMKDDDDDNSDGRQAKNLVTNLLFFLM